MDKERTRKAAKAFAPFSRGTRIVWACIKLKTSLLACLQRISGGLNNNLCFGDDWLTDILDLSILAWAELYMTLAMLVWRFDFELLAQGQKMWTLTATNSSLVRRARMES
jgi:hypothetical protein